MEFIGHNEIRKVFNKLIDKNALSHAHLIIGEDGIGKSTLATIFALRILDKKEERDYADIIHYRLKEKSIGIDEVRDIIQEVNKKPFEGEKKVVIIHKGNKLTIQAQNALLKTIEEPPKGVYIIILCESGEQILDTIKSRCQVHKLSPLSLLEIEEYIDLKFKALDEDKKNAAIAYSSGIPGRAERFINDEKLATLRDLLCKLLEEIKTNNKEAVIRFEESFKNYKEEWEELLQVLLSLVRDISIYKEVENKKLIINSDKLHEIDRLSKEMSFIKLNKIVSIINDTRERLKSNTNFALTLNVMIVDLMEV
ncbi:DNA polymerase III subunit delta' [Clostridium sp. YIM B02551]|uniref:DNA polymerase III subunit delta' n=1 Tax=Clostridium sp. YIM B02551 TaxID=2910679 RepID=UPI001EEA72BC|nr:DNA polymerase III subunit delta' [Clostridium sp. YIM B02551]